MLDQVILMTSSPRTLPITQADPEDVLIVESISGLTAPKVTLFTGSYAGNGGYYQGRRIDQRNPVFTFKLNPKYDGEIYVSDVRRLLYKMFLSPGPNPEGLQVVLVDHRMPDTYFIGNTESIDTDMWAKKQTAQVSMIAVDPFLKTVDETSWAGSVNNTTTQYFGDVGAGIRATFALGPNAIFHFQVNDVIMQLHHPTSEFVWGDVVEINTAEGERSVKLNGVERMAMLDTDIWPELREGVNTLAVWGETPAVLASAKLTSYSYRENWWGM